MPIGFEGWNQVIQQSEYIIQNIIYRASIVELFNRHEGYNTGIVQLPIYTGGGKLGPCCEIVDSCGNFSSKQTEIVCVKDRCEICLPELGAHLNTYMYRYGAGDQNLPNTLESLFIQNEAALVAQNLDRIIFQGDKAAVGDITLSRLDGLIKQADNDPNTVKLNITEGNLWTAIRQIVRALPAQAQDLGEIAVFIPRDYAYALQDVLIGTNYYHYNPGERGLYDEARLPGYSNIRIIPTRGLDGTNRIFATPLNNIHYFTNLDADRSRIFADIDNYHEVFYWWIQFLIGITYGISEYVVSAQIAADVVDAQYCIPVCPQTEAPAEELIVAKPATKTSKTAE